MLGTGSAAPGVLPSAKATAPYTPIPRDEITAGCDKALQPLLASLEGIDSATQKSITLTEYAKLVSAADLARNAVKFATLEPACVGLFARAQTVLGTYIEALNAWSDCSKTTACAVPSIMPSLKQDWDSAAAGLAAIKESLP